MRIKICGITRVEDARYAEKAGADAIGIVMFSPSSPRSVAEPKAQEILDSVGPFITKVIVTHSQSLDDISRIISLKPDAIQISHSFTFTQPPAVRVLRVIGNGNPIPSDCDAIVVDESMGAGRHYDREFAGKVIRSTTIPVILAGGLTPENVQDAIRQIRPYAVDVASGVEEKPGIKDHAKIASFIAAARGV